MAEVITMPRLSDTMEEGTVASWLKKVGDKVEEGDILAEIETDKATMEFESFYEGTLLHIGIAEGETANVDALLAIIGEEGEDISGLLSGETSKTVEDITKVAESSSNDANESADSKTESNDIPEGVEVITMPRLSDTMEEGTVATWLKKVGDTVEEGDILAEIETDKATMEFESFYSGTLLKIGIDEGETAKVDALLAIIGPAGTDVSGITLSAVPSEKVAPKEEKKVEIQENKKAEPKKDIIKSAPQSTGGRIFASPLAKKLAEEKGINLATVQGSGENGRIVKRDIENYQPSASTMATPAYTPVGEESWEEVNNSQMRKTIAKRLGESKFTAPHYYLTVEF